MSIHMPTLFDDEEYFVPPPKKESRKKKDVPEAKDEVLKDAETDVAAGPVVPSQPLKEADAQAGDDNAASEAVPEPLVVEQPVEAPAMEAPADIQAGQETGIVSTEAIAAIAADEVIEPVAPEELAMEVMPESDVANDTPAEITATESIPEPEGPQATEEAVPETNETGAEAAVEPALAAEEETNVTETPVEAVITVAETVFQDTTVIEPEAPVMEAGVSEASAAEALTELPEEDYQAPEMATEQSVELEQEGNQEETNRAAGLQPEVIEVSAVDELSVELPKATPGITFEIPEEEDTPAIELEMTARPIPAIREDKVDDLDQLMRTELISQDYTAFSGFSFEPQPEKKKIIPEPEVTTEEPATLPGKEDINLAVQEIDAAGLDFEFESDALASSLPEFDLENKYYTIGEVAALFGVNVSHIRFWTTEFNLKVRTTRKGDRLYNPENIARLRLIHHLVKENGFTIKGAKEKLKHQKQNVSSQIDLKNKLSGLKDKLERIKKNL